MVKKDFKYRTKFKDPYENFQTRKNGNFTIQMGAVGDRLNIRRIHPNKTPEVDRIRSSTDFFNIHILPTYLNRPINMSPTYKYIRVIYKV